MRSIESLVKRKQRSNFLKNKMGQVGTLGASVIGIVVAVIILVIGLVIVQELRDTQPSTGDVVAWRAANTSLAGLGTFADFVNIIVLAVVASVVIGLIIAGFAFRGRNR